MGNAKQSGFMGGEGVYIDEVVKIRQHCVEYLEQYSDLVLTDNDFVFAQSRLNFHFFKLDEGDNPRVYMYDVENIEEKFVKVSDYFTEFLNKQLLVLYEVNPILLLSLSAMIFFVLMMGYLKLMHPRAKKLKMENLSARRIMYYEGGKYSDVFFWRFVIEFNLFVSLIIILFMNG